MRWSSCVSSRNSKTQQLVRHRLQLQRCHWIVNLRWTHWNSCERFSKGHRRLLVLLIAQEAVEASEGLLRLALVVLCGHQSPKANRRNSRYRGRI